MKKKKRRKKWKKPKIEDVEIKAIHALRPDELYCEKSTVEACSYEYWGFIGWS
jgi:hypothetical protein